MTASGKFTTPVEEKLQRALLGRILRDAQARSGDIPDTLGPRAGLRSRLVWQLERGVRRPTPEALARLAYALTEDAASAQELATKLARAAGAIAEYVNPEGPIASDAARRIHQETHHHLAQLLAAPPDPRTTPPAVPPSDPPHEWHPSLSGPATWDTTGHTNRRDPK